MKKHSGLLLATVCVAVVLFGCKKNNASKDYTASIKNKSWWGSLSYPGDTTQYYSVHFNPDNTLIWSQVTGDYTGKWTVTENILTITFDVNSATIRSTITDDNKLKDITHSINNWVIKNGQLIDNPTIPLDNTVWSGWLYPYVNTGTLTALKLSFLPGNAITIVKGGVTFGPYSYTRSESGAVIKTKATIYNPLLTGTFFCVITSATEMKGSDAGAPFRWNTIKQ